MRASFRAVVFLVIILLTSRTGTASAQFGLGSKPAGSKQSDDQKVNKLLHEKLPLVLDANAALPTVPAQDMLGGPFHGQVLPLTLDTLTKPLPPGDYVLPMTFFCTEYSVHRPGAGTAYVLAPAEGTAAKAMSTLLWRGMLAGHNPQELQSVSWAIQGSVSYDKMPPRYQALIDQLIPDMKNQVNGQAFADIEDGYQGKINKTTKKLSEKLSQGLGSVTGGRGHVDIKVDVELNESFQRLGRLGQMALDGESVSSIVTAAYPSDEARERALYAGAGTQAPPLPAANGPWSVMIPGVAYMRFTVHGGNLQSDNVMQIRILPPRTTAQLQPSHTAHFERAAYAQPTMTLGGPTLLRLFGGEFNEGVFGACTLATEGAGALGPCEVLALTVGGLTAYAIGGGFQAPVIAPGPPTLASIGRGKGERGATGGAAGQNTNNPYKKCRDDPKNPNRIVCKDYQTGKDVYKPKPPNWDEIKNK